jgi:hypothetical protein
MTPSATDGAWSRPPSGVPGRSEVIGFAERTRKNLEFILSAHKDGTDVHVVTQVVLSLLGIVIFPFERAEEVFSWDARLDDLVASGWPRWAQKQGTRQPEKLSQLLRNLRHATAHGGIAFSSDSRFLEEVTITFENHYRGQLVWRASIRGTALLDFCRKFLNRIDQYVG